MSIKELRNELRKLRKTHCPPVSKLKKADIEKEIERLQGHRPTEVQVEEKERKPRAKKGKKETKEMEVQTDARSESDVEETMAERMARVRAARKIGGAVKKHVEAKREEKKKTEEKVETMKKKVAGRKIAEAVKKVVETKKTKKQMEEEAAASKRKPRKLRGEVVTKEVNKVEEKEEEVKQPKTRKLKQKKEEITEDAKGKRTMNIYI